MFRPNYTIELRVVDNDDRLVAKKTSQLTEVIEQSLGEIETWKKRYEEENTGECDQCHLRFYNEELSWTEDNQYRVCQDCVENLVVHGNEQLKEK